MRALERKIDQVKKVNCRFYGRYRPSCSLDLLFVTTTNRFGKGILEYSFPPKQDPKYSRRQDIKVQRGEYLSHVSLSNAKWSTSSWKGNTLIGRGWYWKWKEFILNFLGKSYGTIGLCKLFNYIASIFEGNGRRIQNICLIGRKLFVVYQDQIEATSYATLLKSFDLVKSIFPD